MLQVLLNGIIVGGVYALIATGFNLIYSSVSFYNLAYGAVAFFGAYVTYALTEILGLNFFVSLILSTVAFGFFGVLFWKVFYQKLHDKNVSSTSMIVASFGLLIVIQNLIALIFDNSAKSVDIFDKLSPAYNVFGLSITFNQIVILGFTIFTAIVFEFVMIRTKFGTAIRAVGQNKALASTIGINPAQVINYVFFLATSLSVFGASLISLEIGLKPVYSLTIMLKVVVSCVIGGLGKIRGAFVGGLMLGIVENFGIYYFGAVWQDTVAFTLLIIFLLFKPKGVFN